MESKPRVLINMHYMEIGGAERALLGLLDAIDTNKVSVDLFINQHTGEFMKYIPSKINRRQASHSAFAKRNYNGSRGSNN